MRDYLMLFMILQSRKLSHCQKPILEVEWVYVCISNTNEKVYHMYMIIVDRVVCAEVGFPLQKAFQKQGYTAFLLQLTGGESLKTRKSKEKVEDFLFEMGANRSTTLIGIGGGTLLDLVGFVAATYCRGIGWIAVPTTLLAMTDAAIGGKTGINLHGVKNYLGSIHPPLNVIVDVEMLKTLPQSELRYGLVETIKHGLICDAALFSFVETYLEDILSYNFSFLRKMIVNSAIIKLKIVAQDEKEKGIRQILNFGHTVGHAIEMMYRLPHGRAVAIGLMIESYLSWKMSTLAHVELKRISALCQKIFSCKEIFLDPEQIWIAMQRDKKGGAKVVLLQKIGKIKHFANQFVIPVSKRLFFESFEWAKSQQPLSILA
ncbi:MAG: 3-dehydroquinate synthase [Chlamydiia bacterium]|nr:3-dehydroquinate synthase [Chlamydiia bacterium]